MKYLSFFCILRHDLNKVREGEVAEWPKAHAWKACNHQKWFAGSNPALSAMK